MLIVDDDPISRKMHSRILAKNCDRLDEACNGRDAVDRVQESMRSGEVTYDGILMDSNMPVMNGVTAVKLIRELGYQGKIFGITGNAFQSDIEEFTVHGADEVFVKPLPPSQFSNMIRSLEDTIILKS